MQHQCEVYVNSRLPQAVEPSVCCSSSRASGHGAERGKRESRRAKSHGRKSRTRNNAETGAPRTPPPTPAPSISTTVGPTNQAPPAGRPQPVRSRDRAGHADRVRADRRMRRTVRSVSAVPGRKTPRRGPDRARGNNRIRLQPPGCNQGDVGSLASDAAQLFFRAVQASPGEGHLMLRCVELVNPKTASHGEDAEAFVAAEGGC